MRLYVSGAKRNRDNNRTISRDEFSWYRTKGTAVAAFVIDLKGSSLGGSYNCEVFFSEKETRELVRGYLRGMTLEEVVRLAAE